MKEITVRLPQPSEKQRQFLEERARYVGFGGARGGGKSHAVRMKALLLAAAHPGIRQMIMRRSYPELYANHIRPFLSLLPDGAYTYRDSRKEIVLPNGSVILFRFCGSDKDLRAYQGTETDVLYLDEATQFTEEQFRTLCACVRGTGDFPRRIYLTFNPGGVGHGWAKRLFVDRSFREGEEPDEYVFIRSLVTDNHALMRADPDYIKRLYALPPRLREAWLYGKWDLFEGQFFEELTDDPAHYADRVRTHIIDPFEIPPSWSIARSFDFGYARPFSCGWWAVDETGTAYRILELYGCTENPNEGVRWTPDRIFAEIARMEREHRWLRGKYIRGVADPSIWDASRGESVADTAARHGVYFSPGDNARLPGWMQVHRRLAFDGQGLPRLYAFRTCRAFRRTMPLLRFDPVRPEDLDTGGEDHVADEVRYFCMTRPLLPDLSAGVPGSVLPPELV